MDDPLESLPRDVYKVIVDLCSALESFSGLNSCQRAWERLFLSDATKGDGASIDARYWEPPKHVILQQSTFDIAEEQPPDAD